MVARQRRGITSETELSSRKACAFAMSTVDLYIDRGIEAKTKDSVKILRG